jgi:hypothetical protein
MGRVGHPQRCLAPGAALSLHGLVPRRTAGLRRHLAQPQLRAQACRQLRERGRLHICAAALADAEGGHEARGWLEKQRQSVNELLTPFSDKAINSKLLALCFAQALCSVATLIHDTYLPIYLQDVLGLSNTKVRLCHTCRLAGTVGGCRRGERRATSST